MDADKVGKGNFRMNPKEFLRKWKKGMKEITPQQRLESKIIGHKGAILGLSIAEIALIYRLIVLFDLIQLGFAIFLFFIIWLQRLEYKTSRQQLKGMKEMMGTIEVNKKIDRG